MEEVNTNSKELKKLSNSILSSRKELRKLYEKYIKEFYEVTLKIDKFLEIIGEEKENESREN